MKAGASGFLLKDAPRVQLVEGVRTVAAGVALLAPVITRRLIEQFVTRPPASLRPPLIFGAGAMLLGLALLVLCAAAPATQLGRLRWPTFVAGLCGVASLAFFPFFLLMLWAIGVGARLLAAGRRTEPLAAPRAATP